MQEPTEEEIKAVRLKRHRECELHPDELFRQGTKNILDGFHRIKQILITTPGIIESEKEESFKRLLTKCFADKHLNRLGKYA